MVLLTARCFRAACHFFIQSGLPLSPVSRQLRSFDVLTRGLAQQASLSQTSSQGYIGGPMVIDCHVHILDAQESTLSRLLAAAGRAGVDRLCISSLGRQWDEFPAEDRLKEAAEDVLAACVKYPDRFIGGVYVSADHVGTSLALLDRCVAQGPCRFVKWWVSQYADDPRLDPIVERCVALDVPVLAHTWIKATGNMTRESTCFHVANMARRHPKMRIWMAHCSGRWEEAARVAAPLPNVGIDVSGGEPEDGIVDCVVRSVGASRVFYGSDAPGRNFVVQMSKVLSANLTEEDRRLVLGEGVRKWLHV